MTSSAQRRAERLAEMGVLISRVAPARRRNLDLWVVVAGVAVIVITSFVVRDGTVGDAERSVFEAINGLPDWLEAPLWIFQLMGLLVTPFIVAALALAVGRKALAGVLVATVPLKLFFERWVIKQIVERERPIATLADIAIVRDSSSPGLSFPSGHAIFAFAIAGLLAPYLTRRWQVVLYALAILNGFARVYLGAHNPLDIVSGAAVGAAMAAGINYITKVPESSA